MAIFAEALAGSLSVAEALRKQETDGLSESLTTTEVSELVRFFLVNVAERVRSTDTPTYSYRLGLNLSDAFGVRDGLYRALDALIADTAQVSDVQALVGYALLRVSDALAAQTQISAGVARGVLLADALRVTDAFGAGYAALLQDALSVQDTLVSRMRVALQLSDGVTLLDALLRERSIVLTLADQATAQDTAHNNATLQLFLLDGGVMAAIYRSEETQFCLALNAANAAVTEYDGFGFNSMAAVGPHTLMASGQGLYRVSGTTDAGAPIPASFKTAMFDFSRTEQPDRSASTTAKRIRAVYFGYSAGGDVYVGLSTGRTQDQRWYKVEPSAGDVEAARVLPSLAEVSRYWAVEVASSDAFEIEGMEIVPILTVRRSHG